MPIWGVMRVPPRILRRVLLRRLRRRLRDNAEALHQAEPLIEALVERYLRSGLLNDAAYAASRAEALHRRGKSLAKIRARLAAKGVTGALATDALAALAQQILPIPTSPRPAPLPAVAGSALIDAPLPKGRANWLLLLVPDLAGGLRRPCWPAPTPTRPTPLPAANRIKSGMAAIDLASGHARRSAGVAASSGRSAVCSGGPIIDIGDGSRIVIPYLSNAILTRG